jgi:hypothetical protein
MIQNPFTHPSIREALDTIGAALACALILANAALLCAIIGG